MIRKTAALMILLIVPIIYATSFDPFLEDGGKVELDRDIFIELMDSDNNNKVNRELPSLSKDGGEQYFNILPDTDIHYRISERSIKETIIFKSKPKYDKLKFRLNIGDNTYRDTGGMIVLIDPEGYGFSSFSQPFIESTGEILPYSFDGSVIEIDISGIDWSNVSFPFRIDPSYDVWDSVIDYGKWYLRDAATYLVENNSCLQSGTKAAGGAPDGGWSTVRNFTNPVKLWLNMSVWTAGHACSGGAGGHYYVYIGDQVIWQRHLSSGSTWLPWNISIDMRNKADVVVTNATHSVSYDLSSQTSWYIYFRSQSDTADWNSCPPVIQGVRVRIRSVDYWNYSNYILSSRISPTGYATPEVDLHGYCNASNVNVSQNVSYEYRWYNNGALFREENSTWQPYSYQEINVDNISNTVTSGGENWTISCRMYNGINNTDWLNSSSVSVVDYAIDNCSYFDMETLNVSFYDVTNLGTSIVNVSVIVEGKANYSALYNNINTFQLCIFPNQSSLPESVQIRYDRKGSYSYYNFDTTLTNASQDVILFTQASTETTTFTITDKDTGANLENVLTTMYRRVAGTWQTIESKSSDVTGRIEFSYTPNVEYRFYMAKSMYADYIFYLNPIKFSSYDVKMTRDEVLNETVDYDRIALTYTPTRFYNGLNNFTFLIQSPFDELNEYGYLLSYPGGTTGDSGSDAAGSQLETLSFTITGATSYDRLRLDYYYNTELTGLRNFTFFYPISVPASNYTFLGNIDKTYGLGLFERALVVVSTVLLVVGIATLIGQTVAGMILGLMIFGIFAYIGFVPLWAVIISIAIGVLIISLKGES